MPNLLLCRAVVHVEFTNIGMSVHSNKRHETKFKLESSYHYTLIDPGNLHQQELESAEDDYGYYLKMLTIAAA